MKLKPKVFKMTNVNQILLQVVLVRNDKDFILKFSFEKVTLQEKYIF